MDLSHKKIAVLGFGLEGQSIVNFLLERDSEIFVFDEKPEKEFDHETIQKYKNAGVKFSFHTIPTLTSYDLIVRSPGISLMQVEVEKAKEAGIPITSQTKLFFDISPATIIGVTGTKGKGTTSTLIYEMLREEGLDSYIGGNIGTPPLDFLEKLKKTSWVVLELSSFQLQDLTKSPHIAVLLMITSEHLDYHKDVNEYVDAKRNILRFQKPTDFAVINKDYVASNESDVYTEGEIYFVSRVLETNPGCYVRDNVIYLNVDGKEEKILETDQVLLPGAHNLENICAAVMAATLAGVTKEHIVKVLKEFKGLEHRIELVAEINGVKYYNDSFSTTPETAAAAVEAFDAPEVLILGGSSKNSDFSNLGKVIGGVDNVKGIIGVGKEWPRIKDEIDKYNQTIPIVEGTASMQEIVKQAAEMAEPGDVVLLSPACASFDMFKNYKDRGIQFKEEVLKLQAN